MGEQEAHRLEHTALVRDLREKAAQLTAAQGGPHVGFPYPCTSCPSFAPFSPSLLPAFRNVKPRGPLLPCGVAALNTCGFAGTNPLLAAKLASSDSALRALQRDLEAARYSATQMKQELEEVGEREGRGRGNMQRPGRDVGITN